MGLNTKFLKPDLIYCLLSEEKQSEITGYTVPGLMSYSEANHTAEVVYVEKKGV